MKILVCFLISFSCFATYKFELSLNSNGVITHTEKSTNVNHNMVVPDGWGYVKDGWYRKNKVEEMGLSITGRTTTIDEGVTKYWVDKNYTITVTDLSAEEAAEASAKAEREADISAIKLMIEDVNNSGKPAWEKRLLKFLIKETK